MDGYLRIIASGFLNEFIQTCLYCLLCKIPDCHTCRSQTVIGIKTKPGCGPVTKTICPVEKFLPHMRVMIYIRHITVFQKTPENLAQYPPFIVSFNIKYLGELDPVCPCLYCVSACPGDMQPCRRVCLFHG